MTFVEGWGLLLWCEESFNIEGLDRGASVPGVCVPGLAIRGVLGVLGHCGAVPVMGDLMDSATRRAERLIEARTSHWRFFAT
jgi:hypothetical protein